MEASRWCLGADLPELWHWVQPWEIHGGWISIDVNQEGAWIEVADGSRIRAIGQQPLTAEQCEVLAKGLLGAAAALRNQAREEPSE